MPGPKFTGLSPQFMSYHNRDTWLNTMLISPYWYLVGLQTTKKIMIIVIMINSDDYFPMDSCQGLWSFHAVLAQSFFPGLFFYVCTESPNPQKKPRRPNTTGPKSHHLTTQTPKTQSKRKKSQKNNSGKKYIAVLTDNG